MEYHQTFISTLGVKSSRLLLYPTRSPSPYYRPPFCFRSYFSSLLNVPSVSIESTHEPSKLGDLNPPSLNLSISSHFVSSRRVEPIPCCIHCTARKTASKINYVRNILSLQNIHFLYRRSNLWQSIYCSPRVLSETLLKYAF